MAAGKKALVTGGAGYIGSHVALALLEAGWQVVIIDDLSTGRREAVPQQAGFIKGDMGDPATIGAVLSQHRPGSRPDRRSGSARAGGVDPLLLVHFEADGDGARLLHVEPLRRCLRNIEDAAADDTDPGR